MGKNVSATGAYEIKVATLKKEVQILLEGNFTEQQAGEFIADYNAIVEKITAKDFVLRIDCRDLKLVTAELQPSLEACYLLYKSSGFQSVIFEIDTNPVLKMQLARIARKVGLDTATINEM